jgi:hypothetical protein
MYSSELNPVGSRIPREPFMNSYIYKKKNAAYRHIRGIGAMTGDGFSKLFPVISLSGDIGL